MVPIQVAARYEAWICGRSPAEIAGSNPAGGMDVFLLWVLCVVRWRSLRRADLSSRGGEWSVVCLSVILKVSIMRRPWPTGGLLRHGKKKDKFGPRAHKVLFCLCGFGLFFGLLVGTYTEGIWKWNLLTLQSVNVNPLTPELNPSAQRCLPRFFYRGF
jgi:hypothetical protein